MKTENLDSKDLEDIKRIFEKLNQPEFEYPIYKKGTKNGLIVKFIGLTSGEVIAEGSGTGSLAVGTKSDCFFSHTESAFWQDFDPEELNKPKDKDGVFAWNNDYTAMHHAGFYNAKHDCLFNAKGLREKFNTDLKFDKYQTIPKDQWPDWMHEAYKLLED